MTTQLFTEGDWVACRREALREQLQDTENPWPRFYRAAAGLRGETDKEASTAALRTLADNSNTPRQVAGSAYYELGLEAWSHNRLTDAWKDLSHAFKYPETEGLQKNAGCLLYMMMRKHPEIIPPEDRSLTNQLRTMKPFWTKERIRENLQYRESRTSQDKLSGKPSTWVVSFYRSQIGPAIGSRCELHPSCSMYFLEASKKYGLLGIPLIGDRLVREPGVVQQAEKMVKVGERIRVADPICNHIHH